MFGDIASLYYRKKECPCLGCSERFAGCHGTCESYSGWSKQERDKKDAILKAKQTDNMKDEFEIKGHIHRKKGYLK